MLTTSAAVSFIVPNLNFRSHSRYLLRIDILPIDFLRRIFFIYNLHLMDLQRTKQILSFAPWALCFLYLTVFFSLSFLARTLINAIYNTEQTKNILVSISQVITIYLTCCSYKIYCKHVNDKNKKM